MRVARMRIDAFALPTLRGQRCRGGASQLTRSTVVQISLVSSLFKAHATSDWLSGGIRRDVVLPSPKSLMVSASVGPSWSQPGPATPITVPASLRT